MRLAEGKTLQGYFWLPGNSAEKVPGTLNIETSGAASLTLLGFFGSLSAAFEDRSSGHETILGRVEDGSVTLTGCFRRAGNFSFGDGLSKSNYYVGKVFRGAAVDVASELVFSKLDFEFEGLDEWLGVSGIRVEHSDDFKGVTIRYKMPAEIVVDIGSASFAIGYRATIPGFAPLTEAKVTHRSVLSIRPREPLPLANYQDIVHKLMNLFRLAIGKPVAITALEVSSPAVLVETKEEVTRELPLTLYYHSIGESQLAPRIHGHEMLFKYADIAGTASKIISSWLKRYEELGPALSLYFVAASDVFVYQENRFLSLAQGLETLHRRTSVETLRSPEEFNKLRTAAIQAVPKGERRWLEERLSYANELPLRTRLAALVQPFARYFGADEPAAKFVADIVNTRNYLTHYDRRLEKKACTGIELHFLSERMEALFQLHLLALAGLTVEQISMIAEKTSRLRDQLNPAVPGK